MVLPLFFLKINWLYLYRCCSVAKSHPILCDPTDCHTRLLCPPLSPGVCSNSCPLSPLMSILFIFSAPQKDKDLSTQRWKPCTLSMEKTLVLAFTLRVKVLPLFGVKTSNFYEFRVMSDDIYFLIILAGKRKVIHKARTEQGWQLYFFSLFWFFNAGLDCEIKMLLAPRPSDSHLWMIAS